MMGGSLGHGMERAMEEIIGGIVTSVIVDAFVGTGLLPPVYAVLFSVLNIVGTIAFILAVPYWGTVYLFGWLFGLWIMLQTGMVGTLDAAVYFGVPLVVLVIRFWKNLTD
jgi:hypothetical protein